MLILKKKIVANNINSNFPLSLLVQLYKICKFLILFYYIHNIRFFSMEIVYVTELHYLFLLQVSNCETISCRKGETEENHQIFRFSFGSFWSKKPPLKVELWNCQTELLTRQNEVNHGRALVKRQKICLVV